jgi:UDP-N-acetylmuramoyl-L-alanyl-D-glutamate--2,6-diaminopimelate ligase
MKKLFPQSVKNICHLFQAMLADFWYGFPSRKIKVIGVTGTNGKTTTVQMITKILEEAGFKVAMNSTINFKIGEKEWINKTKFTTLSPFKIQKFIKDSVFEGCDYLVLETSSHSLDQYRVWGINYDVAVITNITREHLDYHKTMEEYRKAKRKLFKNVNTAIVNLDMENPQDFWNFGAKEKYGYTTKVQSSSSKVQNEISKLKVIKADDLKLNINNSQFSILNSQFLLNLPGLFNIENALAAICAGLSQNIDLEKIKEALKKIKVIPGRMEYVPNDKGLNIIIDYAVTPDSLEKLYKLIAEISFESSTLQKKIIAVFGSCGERDRGKRPIMGEIVAKYADFLIVTDEDPYKENPVQIINEVFSGVVGNEVKDDIPNSKLQIPNSKRNTNTKIQSAKTEGLNCWRILDRREAIKKALLLAKPGDFVVVTGKGAEETMAVGKERIAWNDKQVILEELSKI